MSKIDVAGDDTGHHYEFSHNGQVLGWLHFQEGTIPEAGVNGVTNEAVIEALIDRMGKLQKTLPCRENALAITKLDESLMWLERRTQNRKDQGVEGTPKPHAS